MKKFILTAVAAVALATPALAADKKVAAAAAPEAPPNPWDIAFGGGVTSDSGAASPNPITSLRSPPISSRAIM